MNKIKFIMILLIFCLITNYLPAKAENLDDGIQMLKLGNTYRESGDMNKSHEYLTKAISIVNKYNSSWKAKYWNAAAMEYYAYYLRDKGNPSEAKKYFQDALRKYESIISQKDGSPTAIKLILNKMQNINSVTNKSFTEDSYPISGLSTDIINFDNLKEQDVRSKICQLNSLKNFSAANCKLSIFPDCLSNFKNELEYLNLPNNKISALPHFIDDFINLKYLNLSNNKLKSISSEKLSKLKNLKVLDLTNNKIPFTELVNLIRCLPETQILFDKYEKIEEDEENF